jgi:hypothetical protein
MEPLRMSHLTHGQFVFDPDRKTYLIAAETMDSVRLAVAKHLNDDRAAKLAKALCERGWASPDQIEAVRRVLSSAYDVAVARGAGADWDALARDLRDAFEALPTPAQRQEPTP